MLTARFGEAKKGCFQVCHAELISKSFWITSGVAFNASYGFFLAPERTHFPPKKIPKKFSPNFFFPPKKFPQNFFPKTFFPPKIISPNFFPQKISPPPKKPPKTPVKPPPLN